MKLVYLLDSSTEYKTLKSVMLEYRGTTKFRCNAFPCKQMKGRDQYFLFENIL